MRRRTPNGTAKKKPYSLFSEKPPAEKWSTLFIIKGRLLPPDYGLFLRIRYRVIPSVRITLSCISIVICVIWICYGLPRPAPFPSEFWSGRSRRSDKVSGCLLV
jgi:hypothetical protein